MRLAVIVNPLAGGRRPDRFDRPRVERLVAAVAASGGASAVVHVTDRAGAGREIARRALDAGVDVVVAWGGDGTVNEVASVLAGTSVAMGIVPMGSGNGLARELGVPRRAAEALGVVVGGAVRTIDVGRFGGRRFVNVAGVGFDAHVAVRFAAGGTRRGAMRYVGLTLREILRYEPKSYRIRWADSGFDGPASVVAFANSRQYGNGAMIAPRAVLDDGQLDLVIVEPAGALADVWRARRLFTGTMPEDRRVRTARLVRAELEADGAPCCHVDGEPFEGPAHVTIAVEPGALRVCTGGRHR